jgi:predicted metal-dependent phosphoesterase TrpH
MGRAPSGDEAGSTPMCVDYRVDYHVHSRYSYDSDLALEVLVERALETGLDRLHVTDHDTIDGALALRDMCPAGLEIAVGCEFSTEDGSQVLGLGLTTMIVERRLPHILAAIHEQGGRVLLPHPFRRSSGIFRAEMARTAAFVDEMLAHTDLVECFNGRDSYEKNQMSYRFAAERGLAAVAASDAHTPAEVGLVFVEYDASEVIDGVSRRRFYFPDQRPRAERPLKRRAMEYYHRNERRLPPVVGSTYRSLRRQLGRDSGPGTIGSPRLQHEIDGSLPMSGGEP